MGLYLAIAAGVLLILLVLGTGWLLRRKPKHLNQVYYQERWQTLQKLCKDKSTWPLAVIDADKLLDDALKKANTRAKPWANAWWLPSATLTVTTRCGLATNCATAWCTKAMSN
jgi:hypothetical protein